MIIIGLTGGIGSGKSKACEYFRDLGAPVIDADLITRELTGPGQPALARIRREFGDGVFNDGELDRRALRELVFSPGPQARQKLDKLEAILHPLVREEIERRLAQTGGDPKGATYVIVAIPLLIETNYRSLVHRLLVVDLPEQMQMQRTAKRDGIDTTRVSRLMERQCNRQDRLKYADDVIDNSGTLHHLRGQVERLHQHYMALARAC